MTLRMDVNTVHGMSKPSRKVAKTMSFQLDLLEVLEQEARDLMPQLDKPFSAYVAQLVVEARRARGLPEVASYQGPAVVGRRDGAA